MHAVSALSPTKQSGNSYVAINPNVCKPAFLYKRQLYDTATKLYLTMSKGSLTFFKLLVSLFLVSIPFMEAESQSIDMLLLETAKTNAAKSSLDFIGAKSSPLLNGKEYLVYHPREK